ncbi:MAG: flippase-like domain-containing protein [Clostridiales bacterium]|jgi:uncharacterized protein (TIRG00374 family)|nr:flippase-like domain-containing protein [Clostridiales bacterium]
MRKKANWKKLLLVLLPLVILGVMAIVDPNVKDIGQILTQIDSCWFWAAIGSMLLFYFFDTCMYMVAARYMRAPQSFGNALLTTMLGFFYSALTPFSFGGQPMQVLQMRQRGITVGCATSMLVLKFLGWQLVITLFGVAGFVFLRNDILQSHVSVFVMFALGFVFYALTVIVSLLAFLKPGGLFKIGDSVLHFLEKIRFLKNKERILRLHTIWARTIGDYRDGVQFLLKNPTGMFFVFLFAALEALAYMSITYFLYRGLGFHTRSMAHVVLLQSLLYISTSFVPLPGASFASEGGFYLVFSQLFTPAARFPALLIWRALTYYSALLLGLVAVIVDGMRNPVTAVNTEPSSGRHDAVAAAEDTAAQPFARTKTVEDIQKKS